MLKHKFSFVLPFVFLAVLHPCLLMLAPNSWMDDSAPLCLDPTILPWNPRTKTF
ncbi:hypothetical protein L218DRAFT_953026 [Marasmius fiardii PR-910]|nr:hypothetical protein L218DRAFT_953026 [Marasmius fiardii PR-910]